MNNYILNKLAHSLIAFSIITFISGCKHSRKIPTPEDTIVPSGFHRNSNFVVNEKESINGDVSLSERDCSVMNSLNNKDVYDMIKNQKPKASVFFAFDQSALGRLERDAIKSFAKSNPNGKCLIVGHCDWFGTEEYNLGLGERRANSIMEFFRSISFKGGMEVLSRGSLDATSGLSKDNSFKDRRGDVFLIE